MENTTKSDPSETSGQFQPFGSSIVKYVDPNGESKEAVVQVRYQQITNRRKWAPSDPSHSTGSTNPTGPGPNNITQTSQSIGGNFSQNISTNGNGPSQRISFSPNTDGETGIHPPGLTLQPIIKTVEEIQGRSVGEKDKGPIRNISKTNWPNGINGPTKSDTREANRETSMVEKNRENERESLERNRNGFPNHRQEPILQTLHSNPQMGYHGSGYFQQVLSFLNNLSAHLDDFTSDELDQIHTNIQSLLSRPLLKPRTERYLIELNNKTVGLETDFSKEETNESANKRSQSGSHNLSGTSLVQGTISSAQQVFGRNSGIDQTISSAQQVFGRSLGSDQTISERPLTGSAMQTNSGSIVNQVNSTSNRTVKSSGSKLFNMEDIWHGASSPAPGIFSSTGKIGPQTLELSKSSSPNPPQQLISQVSSETSRPNDLKVNTFQQTSLQQTSLQQTVGSSTGSMLTPLLGSSLMNTSTIPLSTPVSLTTPVVSNSSVPVNLASSTSMAHTIFPSTKSHREDETTAIIEENNPGRSSQQNTLFPQSNNSREVTAFLSGSGLGNNPGFSTPLSQLNATPERNSNTTAGSTITSPPSSSLIADLRDSSNKIQSLTPVSFYENSSEGFLSRGSAVGSTRSSSLSNISELLPNISEISITGQLIENNSVPTIPGDLSLSATGGNPLPGANIPNETNNVISNVTGIVPPNLGQTSNPVTTIGSISGQELAGSSGPLLLNNSSPFKQGKKKGGFPKHG